MCLAVPGRVKEIHGPRAVIDYGGGVTREADISLVDAVPGDWVLIHAGFAIEVLSEEAARETIRAWEELLNALE